MTNSNQPTASGNGRHQVRPAEDTTENSGKVVEEFRNFVADIENFLTESTSLTGEQLEAAKRQLKRRIAQTRSAIDELGDTVLARARHTAALTDDYVHDQPWTAVGVGVAVGLLTGLVMSRRH